MSCKILDTNTECRYMLFESDFIKEHLSEIIYQTDVIVNVLQERLDTVESNVTWLYKKYNIFAYASGSPAYFNIFKDLNQCISYFCKEYHVPTHNLWMRNWLNYHDHSEVLKLHDHEVMAHGYISLDPKFTETIFVDENGIEKYKIHNKPGQIYLGPGRTKHYVQNLQYYSEKRITIGLDLETNIMPGVNLGCLPVIV